MTADLARDPLLGTAQALLDAGWSTGAVLARYDAARSRVRGTADDVPSTGGPGPAT